MPLCGGTATRINSREMPECGMKNILLRGLAFAAAATLSAAHAQVFYNYRVFFGEGQGGTYTLGTAAFNSRTGSVVKEGGSSPWTASVTNAMQLAASKSAGVFVAESD